MNYISPLLDHTLQKFHANSIYYITPPRLLRLPLTLNRRERLALRLGVVLTSALPESLSLGGFVSSTAFATTFLADEVFFLGVTLAFDLKRLHKSSTSATEGDGAAFFGVIDPRMTNSLLGSVQRREVISV